MLRKVLFTALLLIVCTPVFAQEKQVLRNANVDSNGNILFRVAGTSSWFFVDPKEIKIEVSISLDGTYVVCRFEVERPCVGEANRNYPVNGVAVYVSSVIVKRQWDIAINKALIRAGYRASNVYPTLLK